MMKKRMISFLLGSTALATSMSFFPLADAQASNPIDLDRLEQHQVAKHGVGFDLSKGYNFSALEKERKAAEEKQEAQVGDDFEIIPSYADLLEKDAQKAQAAPRSPRASNFLAQSYAPSKMKRSSSTDSLSSEESDMGDRATRALDSDLDPKGVHATSYTNKPLSMDAATEITAKLAKAVYRGANPAADRFKMPGYTHRHFGSKDLDETGAFYQSGMVSHHFNEETGRHEITVTMRGTDCGIDWGHNGDARKVTVTDLIDGESLTIHKGFYDYHTKIMPSMMEVLKGFLMEHGIDLSDESNTDLTVTGHSLGGAESTLTALMLKNKYKRIINLVNYASPRMCGTTSAAKITAFLGEENIKRVWRLHDAVPAAAAGFLGFAHIGRSGGYVIDESKSSCLNPMRGVNEHSMGLYAGAIEHGVELKEYKAGKISSAISTVARYSGLGKAASVVALDVGVPVASGVKAVGSAGVTGVKAGVTGVKTAAKAVGNAGVTGVKAVGSAGVTGVKAVGHGTYNVAAALGSAGISGVKTAAKAPAKAASAMKSGASSVAGALSKGAAKAKSWFWG